MNKRLQVVTLGCSKNTVDTEHLLAQVGQSYEIVPEGVEEPVDVLLLNTCGFIGDAKEESIQAILEAAERKKSGLVEARKVLRDVDEIGFCHLKDVDVVRHQLVKKVISAYDDYYRKHPPKEED